MNTEPSNIIELMDAIADSLGDERDFCEVIDDLIDLQLHVEQWMMEKQEHAACLKLIDRALGVKYKSLTMN